MQGPQNDDPAPTDPHRRGRYGAVPGGFLEPEFDPGSPPSVDREWDEERAAPPPAPERTSGDRPAAHDPWLSDYRSLMEEIDSALMGLEPGGNRPSTPGRPRSVPTPRSRPRPASGRPPETPPDRRGGYLDERLGTATMLAASLRGEIARLDQQVAAARAESDRLDEELHAAMEELRFIRREPWALDRPGNAILADDPRADGEETAGPRPDDLFGDKATRAPYTAFTQERYDATVDRLSDRRTWLRNGVLAASIGLSLTLLLVTLRYAAPATSPWLTGLPMVWLLPVPFFASAFLGSQRLLAQRSLRLSGTA